MDVSGIKCPDNDHSYVTNLILFGTLYIRRNQAGLMKTCKVKSHSHQSSSTYLPPPSSTGNSTHFIPHWHPHQRNSTYLPLPHPWEIVPISFLTGTPTRTTPLTSPPSSMGNSAHFIPHWHPHHSSSTYLRLPHPWDIMPISFLTGIPLPQVVIAEEGIQFSRAIYPKIIISEKSWPNYCGLKYFIIKKNKKK